MSNGCGCQTGFLKYIKPPYANYFYIPCCIHDDEYDLGKNRKKADRDLFLGCMKIILKNENNPWKILWLTGIAGLYYIAVRIFGRHYFNKT